MFKEDIKHVKENLLVWDFDLTIVADWSLSMEWEENRQQKIAILLIFEALKLLHDKLEMDKHNLEKPINFSTEWIMFKWRNTKNFKKSSNWLYRYKIDLMHILYWIILIEIELMTMIH